jgi:uncharacterized membrane protein
MPLNTPYLAVLLALTAATCWGSADFTGGLGARRSDAYRSVLVSYSVGLVALTIAALARGEVLTTASDLGWGAVAGLSGMLGLIFLFRGFAQGRMGIVAPVSAVLATAMPVVFNAFTAGLPNNLILAGFGAALTGIWLLSRPERLGGRPVGLGMAIMAGLGFGGFFITLDQVGVNAVFWPLVAGRVAAVSVILLVALAARRPLRLRQLPLRILTLSGLLDISGNLFFLLAIQNGRLDIAAVLASLYPAVTAILARITIKEQLTRLQMVGVSAAMLAIVLITL